MALTEIKQGGLDDEAVNEAKLQVSNAGTNGQYLQKQSGNTGGLTWADAGASVGGADGVDFNDNVKARFGTGNDFEILHDGTDSYLSHGLGSGLLRINAAAGSEIRLTKSGPETLAKFIPDGAVKLYYDNATKFETVSYGIVAKGSVEIQNGSMTTADSSNSGTTNSAIFGTGSDLKIYHDGTDNYFDQVTGYLRIRDVTNSREIAKFHSTNSQEFYMNGTKRLEVTNTGISVTGNITPSGGIYLGGSGGSNFINDYEEGTWTPQIRFGNGAPSGVTYSGSNNGGVYTKIGRLIMCIGEINLTSKGSSTGYFAITGFPYNEGNYGGNLSKAHSSIGHYYNMNNWERWFGLDMFSNDDVAIFRGGNNSNTNNDRNNSDVNNNTNIQFAVTYFTDE